ncbi:MAG: COX15/CtaA family protein [Ferruginibacter sp.]
MAPSSSFLRFSKLVLVFVFLVIIAGAVVRMTQSGMGCPDWPKCFGSWIPPTDASQLPANYESYLKKQDIDHSFNVFHTWTEYINRLLGALLGFLLIIQFAWSIKLFWKSNRKIVWFSLGLLLLTGFQGWLGKRVVDANLATVKITTHMLVALLIALLALVIIHLQTHHEKLIVNKKLKNITLLTIVLLLLQIALGTEVREQIDHISKELNYDAREYWIGKLDYVFYIHRSFSLLVGILCFYIFIQVKKTGTRLSSNNLVLASVVAVILLGITMAYFNIPAIAQPLHLLFSSLLFIALCNNWLKTNAS